MTKYEKTSRYTISVDGVLTGSINAETSYAAIQRYAAHTGIEDYSRIHAKKYTPMKSANKSLAFVRRR